MPIMLQRLFRLFWLISDQGIFAGTNFILNILFARWLSASDYGLFALSFSGYLLLTGLHYGAILEPMLILSPQIPKDQQRSYIMSVSYVHLMITLLFVLLGIGLFTVSSIIGLAVIGAGVGGSFILMLIAARRLCLVFFSPKISAMIGLVYCVGVIASGYLLYRYLTIDWFTSWILMGLWSLICSICIILMLLKRTSESRPFSLRDLYSFQKTYAPWAVASSFSTWCTFDGLYFILAHFSGLQAVAQTRAVFNIGSPLVQVNAAMHASWLILFSNRHSTQEKHGILALAVPYIIVYGMIVLVVTYWGHSIVHTLYNGKYDDGYWQLSIYVTVVGMSGLTSMITSNLKAKGLLRLGYIPQFANAAVSVSTGLFLIIVFGQVGLITAVTCGAVVALSFAISASQE